MASVKQLCAALTDAEADGAYDKMLDAANKLIGLGPKNVPAHRCKLVALIKLGLFDEALKLIAEVPAKQLGDTAVEKSYILYRQNRNEESLAELEHVPEENPAAMELKAQLFYRMNRYQESYDTYKILCRDLVDDENEDLRRANLLAATTKLHESGIEREPTTSELDTHEQLFNQACHLIACKRYDEAAKALQLAKVKCVLALKEDGCSEKEIENELKPLKLQATYVTHQLTRNDEAKTAAKQQRKKKKIRLPKNYDPNVKPDPERWLPKNERTANKKKVNKKFKDRNLGRGNQGATSTVNADKIDYSNTAVKEATQSPKPTPPTPQAAAEGPRQQRKQQQKKKKKGGRW